MGKSIFDRNPITEMFSSVEEAMKCANSKELDGMLKNAFKGITSDPVLGKNNKSKQKMSVVIIADSDDSKLENKENMNYTRMQRYSAGGKKLRPIPADNKGLQALAKKNPKLVMDMGFDPNRIAGETKGKKKKGPKVPKNQNVEGQNVEGQNENPIPDTDVLGDDLNVFNAMRRMYYDSKTGDLDPNVQAGQILRMMFSPVSGLSEGIIAAIYPFLSEDEQAKIDASRATQAQASQDLDNYEEQLEKELAEKGETMINFRDLSRYDMGTGGGKEGLQGLLGKFKNLVGIKEDGGTGYAVPKQLNASYSSPLSAMGSALINQGANMQDNMGDQVNNGGELTEQTEDLNVAPVTNLAVGGQMFGQSAAGSFNPMGNMQGNTGNMPQKVRMMVQSMLSQVDMLKQKAASGEISETDLQEQASPLLAQVQEIINNYS